MRGLRPGYTGAVLPSPPPMSSEESSARPGLAGQRQKRIRLERKVSLKFKDLGGFVTELSHNLSMGGMFLRTDRPQPPGTLFDFELNLEAEGPVVQGIGEVVWTRDETEGVDRPAGMGVRFLELAPGSRALIFQVVDHYIRQGGEPFDLNEAPAVEKGTAQSPTTTPPADFPPESPAPSPEAPRSRPARAGSYAVIASPQRKKREERTRGSRRRTFRWAMSGAAIVLLAAVAVGATWWLSGDSTTPPQPEEEPSAPRPAAGETETEATREATEDEAPSLASVAAESVPEPQEPERADRSPAPGAEAGATPTEDGSEGDPQPAAASPSTDAGVAGGESPGSEPSPTASPATTLRDITWVRRGDALSVTLVTDGVLGEDRWNHFRMDESPAREVVRLRGIREPYRPAIPVDAPELQRIRTGHHRKPGGDELHVVLDLASPRVHLTEIEADGSRLRLTLRRQ